MKVAIVHDYIKEFGGAERVLKEISNLFPGAPIYTAFRVKGSTADKEFRDKKIVESFLAPILKIGKLYSALRFLAPTIWKSFDLTKYDLVISSSSWFVTKGFRVGKNTKVIVYCHTPPRWLYGYETSVGFTKYWPVKIYAAIVGHFMRIFDFASAQEVDYFIANSKEVSSRIEKFYRRDSVVIYPPIEAERIRKTAENAKKEDFYLIVSRLVGAKGIEDAIAIFSKLGKRLKVVGEAHGFSSVEKKIRKSKGKIEILGYVADEEKYKLMAEAKAFIALAKEEDFGMTVVESHAAGTPTVAYYGGGFKETVKEGLNGVFINEINEAEIKKAIEKVEETKWNRKEIMDSSQKYSTQRFKKEMLQFVNAEVKK